LEDAGKDHANDESDSNERPERGRGVVARRFAIVGRADERARIVAKEFGVSLDDHQPRHLTTAMVKAADLILIMDNRNEASMRVLYPDAMQKVFCLGAYSKTTRSRRNAEIDDPDRGTLADIRACYQILEHCIRQLTATVRQEASREGERAALPAPS